MSDERADPGDHLVGSVIAGRYRVVRRLGVGAMGAVYLGEHMRIGRRDAIKVLRASMAQDPEAIARFTRGARNVSRIRHPNVCTLYDFGDTEEGFHFLAMEYVDGPTLGTLLEREGPLPPERAVPLIVQVAEALYAAHQLGIVHRDLKPDNIMVARDADGGERVKVVDFDIARGPAEEEGPAVTRHGFVVGTPEYMSPEQLTGDPLDGRSDVYSMALVLFRTLTGRLPFEGETAQEIMVQRLTREPMSLAEVTGRAFPPALEEALAKGLRRKAEERPDDARSFAAAVKEAIAPGGPAPSPSQAPAVAPPPSRDREIPATRVSGAARPASTEKTRRTALLAGGGMAALLVVGVVAAVILRGGGLAEPDPAAPPTTAAEDLAEADPGAEGDAFAAAGDDRVEDEEGPAGATVEDPPETAGADRDAPPPEAAGSPGAPATPPAAGGIRLDLAPGSVTQFLYGQFLAQGEDPDRPTLEAVRDTVTAVMELDGLAREDRAFAAYILGLALIPLGDSVQGVRWLEEAVRLDPVERHTRALSAHTGGGG